MLILKTDQRHRLRTWQCKGISVDTGQEEVGQEDATRGIYGYRAWMGELGSRAFSPLLQTAACPVCGGRVLYWLGACTQWPQNPTCCWDSRNWALSLLVAKTRTRGSKGCSASTKHPIDTQKVIPGEGV